MTKQQFLNELRGALSGLPSEDIEERVAFYGEMIDDRMEEGLGEEEAVAGAGSIESIRAQTVDQIPLPKLVREKVLRRRELKGWQIALMILGFPLWFPLLVAAGAVIISVYAALWAVIISLWAAVLAVLLSGIVCIAAAAIFLFTGNPLPSLMAFGAALFLLGLSLFAFLGCAYASKGLFLLTKQFGKGIKRIFAGKEKTK